MKKCFVIQPFDGNKFDKRYHDIFKPAILEAGCDPYRIDADLGVNIIITEIEQAIDNSYCCFAEISTDNPNVWYELGYAMAKEKNVVMVSSDERTGQYPFDIRHRLIINYHTASSSDFEHLKRKITERIITFQKSDKTIERLSSSSIVETQGLKPHEISLLILIMENCLSKEDSVAIFHLKSEMEKAGYTGIAVSVGVRTLEQNELIRTYKEREEWGNYVEYTVCQITDKGERWVLSNQNLLPFHKTNSLNTDDLPF